MQRHKNITHNFWSCRKSSAASQRLVRFSLPAQLSTCSNHDLPYLKYFDTHRDSRVREGDDAGRVSPFATSIGDDCRANKG